MISKNVFIILLGLVSSHGTIECMLARTSRALTIIKHNLTTKVTPPTDELEEKSDYCNIQAGNKRIELALALAVKDELKRREIEKAKQASTQKVTLSIPSWNISK